MPLLAVIAIASAFAFAFGLISPLVVFAIFTLCALVYWVFDDSPRDVG